MIIFDLDGTLANCEHRRHFVDYNHWLGNQNIGSDLSKFKPDWKSFYEACDQDKPILPTIHIINHFILLDNIIEIWSGRCESVKEKTEKWLADYLHGNSQYPIKLKMRPIGDITPDDILKEKWLDEYLDSTSPRQWEEEYKTKHPIDFVFDDRPKVIRMWRRRGIFVFNCCQHDSEF
jgi:hypothetical protein